MIYVYFTIKEWIFLNYIETMDVSFCANQIIYLSYKVINNKEQEDTIVLVLPVYVF